MERVGRTNVGTQYRRGHSIESTFGTSLQKLQKIVARKMWIRMLDEKAIKIAFLSTNARLHDIESPL